MAAVQGCLCVEWGCMPGHTWGLFVTASTMPRTLPEWVSFAQASLNHDTSFQSHKTSILFYVTKTVSIGFTLHIKKNLYRQKHNNTKITYYHSKTIHGKKKGCTVIISSIP